MKPEIEPSASPYENDLRLPLASHDCHFTIAAVCESINCGHLVGSPPNFVISSFGSLQCYLFHALQGHSQNLKEVPQNFTEVFNVDDVTAKTSYREINIAKKKINLSSIIITDVK